MATNVSMQGLKNWQASPLFHTYQLASGTPPATISFFNTIQSSELSNIRQASQLVNGEQFHIMAMRFVFVGMALADIISFQKQYVAVLHVGGKDLLTAPVDYWAGGAGVAGAVATTATTTTIQSWSNGVPDPRAIAGLGPEGRIELDASMTFGVELRNTGGSLAALTAAAFIRCYLDGLHGRNVG